MYYSTSEKGWFVKPAVEKTARIQTRNGIPVPKYFALAMEYFWNYVRPSLVPNENVKSWWISHNGTPLGNLFFIYCDFLIDLKKRSIHLCKQSKRICEISNWKRKGYYPIRFQEIDP
jgi:hypothetical protein